jgi:inorganic pyrophosphatase
MAAPTASEMTDDDVLVFVEIPSGSRNKYEYDPQRGRLVLDRMLFTATRYPADYGFVDGTLAEDGDPLDALVLVSDPTFPGCLIRARVIGLFRMEDEKGRDDKVLGVPLRDPLWSYVHSLDDLPPTVRAEIEHFFAVYKNLEGKPTRTQGFVGRDEALRAIADGRRRAQETDRIP